MVGLVEGELGRVFRCHQNKEQTAVAAGHTHCGPLDAFNQSKKEDRARRPLFSSFVS